MVTKLQTAMEEMEALTALLEGDAKEIEEPSLTLESNLAK